MSEPTHSPELASAILSAQRAVKAALKSSTNTYHNYKYASAEQVLIVGREALNDAGLVMIPISEDFEQLTEIDDRCGGAVAVVRCKYTVIHESGASLIFSTDVPVVPERGRSSGWSRPADKACFGARTEALGYALRDLLLIPREDAPDVSGRKDGERTGPGPRPPEPQASKPAPLGLDACLAAIQAAKGGSELAKAVSIARRDRPAEDHPAIDRAFATRIAEVFATLTDATQVSKLGGFLVRANLKDEQAIATAQKALDEAKSKAAPQ